MNPNLFLSLMVLAILVWPVARWLEERHRRKLAYHRLMIARAVTAMERLMRDGKIRQGEACHDWVHAVMIRAQFLDRFPVKVLPRPLTTADIRFREQLSVELARGTPAVEPIRLFVDAFMGAFQAERPIVGRVFAFMTLMQWLVYQALPPASTKRTQAAGYWTRAKAELVVRSTHAQEFRNQTCYV